MLKLIVPEQEFFDESKGEFFSFEETELRLEHSLLSLSKWESFFEKPFLGTQHKTDQETLYYIWFMFLDEHDVSILDRLTSKNVADVNDYINSKQSATIFGEMPNRPGRNEIITAELIYYWMVAFTIPFECESWHLNRLFSLIKICNIKNSKPDKRSKADIAKQYATLNAQRKAQLGTTG